MKLVYNFKSKRSDSRIYDSGTIKVIVFACTIIILSISFVSYMTFNISKKSVVDKLKGKDLIYITESIASKIDGRIQRAKETSLLLSRDPAIIDWIKGKEANDSLKNYALGKIADVSKNYDYDNSFIVSTLTNHYWSEDGVLIDTLSIEDPDDSWLYELLKGREPISIVIDYNDERKGTYVFVDALVYSDNKPIAVTGVGLSLDGISKEFQGYKFGESSNMWLIDDSGKVYLSEDVQHINNNISQYLPEDIVRQITSGSSETKNKVMEYKHSNGETYDLIYKQLDSTNWKLVFQIPRSESLSILKSIMLNTLLASVIAIVSIVAIFFLISYKMANPYKRALAIQKELEEKVAERTRELKEKNDKIMDSIEYAKMIQESILPSRESLTRVFKEHFIIWKPRDIVGGDFYWAREVEDGFVVAVGDCTGHGVPGALMTMAVNSMLDHIVDNICHDNPGEILRNLNRMFKKTLNNRKENNTTDDGMDIGVLFIHHSRRLIFSGAKISLYVRRAGSLDIIRGNNKGLGYKRIEEDYEYINQEVNLLGSDTLYIATDGYTDQNGGEKNNSFGRKRFEGLINENHMKTMSEQRDIFEEEIAIYMGDEQQRDDITLLCGKL